MSAFARLALAAGLAITALGAAPAQAAFSTATFDFSIAGLTVTGASANGSYTSPTMPAFCIGPNADNCAFSGMAGSFSFADISETLGRITFSFTGSTGSGAQNFGIALSNFSGDFLVTDVTYNAGTLGNGGFGLSSWDGTTASFLGVPSGNFSALGGRQISFDVTLAPVPEPASLALLGAALAGLGIARRRRAA